MILTRLWSILRAQSVDDAALFIGGVLDVQGDKPFKNSRLRQTGWPVQPVFYLPVPASPHVSPETARGHTLHLGTTGFIHKQKQHRRNYE